MSRITQLYAHMVFDSRGQPTVYCNLTLDNQFMGDAMVPSGASTGQFEAIERRDGDERHFLGRGVNQVIETINDVIKPVVLNQSFITQAAFDAWIQNFDGTSNYGHIGANAALALSMAFANADARANQKPLYEHICQSTPKHMPIPMFNVINGGAHANNGLAIQEFMLVPYGCTSFDMAMEAGVEIYQRLKTTLKQHGHSIAVGDEGGFAPDFQSAYEALDVLAEVVEKSQFSLGKDIAFALDIAASEFYHKGSYHYEGQVLQGEALAATWLDMQTHFPIISFEDPFADDDYASWRHFNTLAGDQAMIIGDDLLVTQVDKLNQGIESGWMNAILIKPNQVGTVTQTLATIEAARRKGMMYVISHRSGETEDTFIADLALATEAPLIKTGAPCRSERLAKYNRLLQVNHHLHLPLCPLNITVDDNA